jgi:hypothetical protein
VKVREHTLYGGTVDSAGSADFTMRGICATTIGSAQPQELNKSELVNSIQHNRLSSKIQFTYWKTDLLDVLCLLGSSGFLGSLTVSAARQISTRCDFAENCSASKSWCWAANFFSVHSTPPLSFLFHGLPLFSLSVSAFILLATGLFDYRHLTPPTPHFQ